jgi:hypothetical protein
MTFAGGAAFVTGQLNILWPHERRISRQRARTAGTRISGALLPGHHRSDLGPSAAPSATTSVIDSPYQAATNSGESSGQCIA